MDFYLPAKLDSDSSEETAVQQYQYVVQIPSAQERRREQADALMFYLAAIHLLLKWFIGLFLLMAGIGIAFIIFYFVLRLVPEAVEWINGLYE